MSDYSEIMARYVNKYVDKKPEDVNPNVDNAAGGQAMRLKRHDELVGRMAQAGFASKKDMAAALDALLAAVVEMGVGYLAFCPDEGTPTSIVIVLEENSHDE